MRRLLVALICIVFCTQAGVAGSGEPQAPLIAVPKTAVATAKTWLDLAYGSNSSQSWEQASPYFQAHVSMERWTDTVKQIHDTFGRVIARSYVRGEIAPAPQNASMGQYLILDFSIAGARRPAREIVTMVMVDGSWKVAGLFVYGSHIDVRGVGLLPHSWEPNSP